MEMRGGRACVIIWPSLLGDPALGPKLETPMHPDLVPVLQQAISMPGGGELLLILLIVLVVFGHNRLPAIGAGFGQAIKNFKKSMASDEEKEGGGEREKDRDQNKSKALAERNEHTAEKQDANKVL
jgi:sec-independent protein translocase protein TatA